MVEGQANSKWDDVAKNYLISEDNIQVDNGAGTIENDDLNKMGLLINQESESNLSATLKNPRDPKTDEQNFLHDDYREMYGHTTRKEDIALMKELGEVRDEGNDSEDDYVEAEDKQLNGESVSMFFKEQIIKRAPDKMVHYLDGNILIAFRNKLIYVDLVGCLSED